MPESVCDSVATRFRAGAPPCKQASRSPRRQLRRTALGHFARREFRRPRRRAGPNNQPTRRERRSALRPRFWPPSPRKGRTPCVKEQSGGAPVRCSLAAAISWRRAARCRIRVPIHRARERRLCRLSFSGSPAYTPETKGATRYSRISWPNFRRTKAATDSSSEGGCDFAEGSEAIFQRETGLRSVEASRACGDIGILRSWPWRRT